MLNILLFAKRGGRMKITILCCSTLFIFLCLVGLTSQSEASGCESDHWVQHVSSDGQIVILEDGSVWRVNPVDAIDSMLWLPTTSIVTCDDKLINSDDGEVVSAIRIR